MNKIFYLLNFLIFGLVFSQNTISQNQKIDSIIIGNQTFEAYQARIIEYGIKPIKEAYPNTPKAFWNEIDSKLTDSEILKQIREVYQEVFTENEINELYNSVTSKSYKKYNLEYGKIQEGIQEKFSWISKRISELQESIAVEESSSKFNAEIDTVPVKTNLPDGFYEISNDESKDISKMKLSKKAAISLKNVSTAKANLDGLNRLVISIELDEEGSALFHLLSYKNIGKAIAIVVDKKIISAPVVNDVIPNGKIQISGKFSSVEVDEIIKTLNSK